MLEVSKVLIGQTVQVLKITEFNDHLESTSVIVIEM